MSDDGETCCRLLGEAEEVGNVFGHFPRLTLGFKDTGILPTELQVHSDSDWAGCLRGCVTMGGTATKTWNTIQPTIALSSGEAELNAFVNSAAEEVGEQSLARVWRWGVRHLDVKDLWVHERAKRGACPIARVSGDVNPGGVATKLLAVEDFRKRVESVGAEILPRQQRWAINIFLSRHRARVVRLHPFRGLGRRGRRGEGGAGRTAP